MFISNFNTLKANIINSHSLLDYFRFDLNIPVRSEGQSILAPSFIRSESHPSFAVYSDHAFDFTTHTHYNILDIYALQYFGSNDFPNILKAAEHFAGHSFSDAQNAPSQYTQQLADFSDLILQWHKNLLANPLIWHDGSQIPILDYLAKRRISTDTIKKLKLGYCPENSKHPMFDRLIIPYYLDDSCAQPVYANGRYMGRNQTCPKYKKFWLDDPKFSLFLKNYVWGLDSQHPGRIVKDVSYNPDTQEQFTLETHHIKYDFLVIPEGAFDALAFWQEGYQVGSSLGCNFSHEQKKELLQSCRHYADKGQKVFLCLDNDNAGSNGQYDLALFLFKNRIPFVVGHIPQCFTVSLEGHPQYGQSIKVKDVSDYYSAGGDLESLIHNAKPGVAILADHCRNERELAQLFNDTAKFADKLDLFNLRQAACNIMDDNGEVEYLDKKTGEIKTIMDQRPRFPKSTVNFLYSMAAQPLMDNVIAEMTAKAHQIMYDTVGQFYEYSGGIWRTVHDLIIQRYVADTMGGKLSSNKINAVCKYLKIMFATQGLQFNTKPIWVFRNGTLWLDKPDGITFTGQVSGVTYKQAKPDNFTESSPDDMATIQMNYDYIYGAVNNTLLKYIHDWTGGVEDKQILLQQMAGYVLYAANTLQKFFYLIGDGANGKSTFLQVLENLFGKDNCSSLQFHRFHSEFDTIALKNSRLNICYDARTELGGAEDILKAVSSGDSIMAAHKGVDAEKFTTNAKVFVAANRYFSASDVSRGLLRRILFVCFDQNFEGSGAKTDILDEIKRDPGGMAGVFNWAYDGYKMLKKNGGFIETEEQKKLIEEFKKQLSPLMMFAREEMYSRFECEMPEKELYQIYGKWCIANGEKKLSRTKFIYEIRQVLRTDGSAIKADDRDEFGLCIFRFPKAPEGYKGSTQIQEPEIARTQKSADAYSGELSGDAGELSGTSESSETLQEESRQVKTTAEERRKFRADEVLNAILEQTGSASADNLQWKIMDTPEGREKAACVFNDCVNLVRHSMPWRDVINPFKRSEAHNCSADSVREDNKFLFMYLAKNPDKIDEFISGVKKKKTYSAGSTDGLNEMMHNPDYVHERGSFKGCTNQQIWDYGWQYVNALSKMGRRWQECAERDIRMFRVYEAMSAYFMHEPDMKFMLPGYQDFLADVVYTKFQIADDEQGTMTPINDEQDNDTPAPADSSDIGE